MLTILHYTATGADGEPDDCPCIHIYLTADEVSRLAGGYSLGAAADGVASIEIVASNSTKGMQRAVAASWDLPHASIQRATSGGDNMLVVGMDCHRKHAETLQAEIEKHERGRKKKT